MQETPGLNTSTDKPRIGVYLCDCGGNISDTVECQRVTDILAGLPDVAVSRRCQFMCSDAGKKLVTDDIKEKGVNRVVVGACSIFLHEQTFRKTVQRAGLNPYLYCTSDCGSRTAGCITPLRIRQRKRQCG
jgi:heterodisulfide reductase subunit A